MNVAQSERKILKLANIFVNSNNFLSSQMSISYRALIARRNQIKAKPNKNHLINLMTCFSDNDVILFCFNFRVCMTSWPGASIILIRGHKHLQECAYIGDDSSEELEELLEIAEEKGIGDLHFSSPESPANRVELLTKHRPGVEFHDERLRENKESFTFSPLQELAKDSEDNISGKRMKALLSLLPHKANKFKSNVVYNNNTHIGKQVDRLKNQLKIEIENRERLNKTGATGKQIPSTLNILDFMKLQQADHVHKVRGTNIGNHETENVQISLNENASNNKSDDTAKRYAYLCFHFFFSL